MHLPWFDNIRRLMWFKVSVVQSSVPVRSPTELCWLVRTDSKSYVLAPGLEEHIKALSRGEFTKIGGKYQNYFNSVVNQLDEQNFCFTISLFHASTCFEHMCSKHLEAWNKLIVKQKFCASSWLITEMHGQQNIKICQNYVKLRGHVQVDFWK